MILRILAIYMISISSFASSTKISSRSNTFEQKLRSIISFLGKDDPNLVGLKQNIACNEEFESIQIKNCGASEAKVFANYTRAREYMRRLINQVENYPNASNPKASDVVEAVLDKLYCMEGKLNKIKFECRSGGSCSQGSNRMAYADFREAFGIVVGGDVKICPYYFSESGHNDLHRAATIVHEVSHLCGAEDYGYYDNGGFTEKDYQSYNLPVTNQAGQDTRVENADNYSVWAIGGFCIPGFDCHIPRK